MKKGFLFLICVVLLIAMVIPVFAVDQALVDAAKAEKVLVSYGLPDGWANYAGMWEIYQGAYGIERMDTDMSSGEIIQTLRAEMGAPVADISDLGMGYAKIIEEDGLSQAYQHAYWAEIPDFAKSADGLWSAAFWGAVAITTNLDLVENAPKSFADLMSEEYFDSICIRNPTESATGSMAVLAMAYANGGSEADPQPGIDFFEALIEAGNVRLIKPNVSNIEKGECPIAVHWDYDGLSAKKRLTEMNLEMNIPTDGTAVGMYVQFVSAGAPHPNAAKLMIETMYSDEGQLQYAYGFAHPVRAIEIPAELKAMFPPDEAYANAYFPKDYLQLAAANELIVAAASEMTF